MSKEKSVSDLSAMQSPKRQGRRVWLWIGAVVTGLSVVGGLSTCALLGFVSSWSGRDMALGSGDAVAVIYVEGPIGISSATMGRAADSAEVVEYIRQAEGNRRVKAIVVYVNSPGGTMVPADEMYQALRQAEKPVVAFLGDVAASGGYYVACGADKIVAHPATITGSISVYMIMINAADLLEKLGVEGIIVRSGDAKAIGNWFEHPTEDQLAIEQGIVDELNEMFIQVVVEGRDMDENEVRELADGRPFTGQQALGLGLVDALGNVGDAISMAAEIAGIEGELQVIEYRHTPSLLETWTSAQQSLRGEVALLEWLDAYYEIPQARYVGP